MPQKNPIYTACEVTSFDVSELLAVYDKLSSELDSDGLKWEAVYNTFYWVVDDKMVINISDFWHHVLYKFYIDISEARNPIQSWRSVSGRAFEEIMAKHYTENTPENIKVIALGGRDSKMKALEKFGIEDDIGDEKLDLVAKGQTEGGEWVQFAGIHLKTSLRERIAEDVPTSRKLQEHGYFSPLVTLDIKINSNGVNCGGLGNPRSPVTAREFIEQKGEFDNLYSYNFRTKETTQENVKARIVTTSFKQDIFCTHLSKEWDKFRQENL